MRALWSGHITCGLVSVPVRLYAATEAARPQLHEVHVSDGARIRHRRVCEAEDREVGEEEIGRGWQASDGRMVVLRDEDLDHLPLATRRRVEILGFVDDRDVDPLLYDRAY
ncbi:Ku protein, partial [Streptomyces swartbergensis]